jgi:hypothetical protein
VPHNTPQSAGKSFAVPLTVAVVTLLVTAVMVLPRCSAKAGPTEPSSAAETCRQGSRAPLDPNDPLLQVIRRDAGDPLALGDVDAPVVMVNYSEFQCPFCGKFARDTEPELIEQYVEDGTLRIEWRDFPYLGPESTRAAPAGRAAAAQGRFWDFHDALFADQPPPNSGKLTEDHLVRALTPTPYLGALKERVGTRKMARPTLLTGPAPSGMTCGNAVQGRSVFCVVPQVVAASSRGPWPPHLRKRTSGPCTGRRRAEPIPHLWVRDIDRRTPLLSRRRETSRS